MSPWGTLDDEELIANDDEEGDAVPIWGTFPDREEWTPKDAVDAYFGRFKKFLECIGEGNEEAASELESGIVEGRGSLAKIFHMLSMVTDDLFEMEYGLHIQGPGDNSESPELYCHKKVNVSGSGIGNLFKAVLVI